jgi:RecB family exonuclease
MDHGQFGDLVHRALHAFAKGPGRNASRASDITEALMHALDIQVALLHGEQPTTPVWLQIESARRRLQAFALRQAEHREQGWTIAFTEWIPSQGVQMIEVDGAPFGLRGRIDRIDRHPDGRIAILDYKTSDRPVKAESALSSKGEWLDLQLPLYRHLINEILPPRGLEQVVLGYITLPRESEETAIVLPEWTGPDFNLADKLTHEVIRAIRRGEFDDIGSVYPTGGSLDALCGIGILGVEPPAIEESK